MWADGKGTDMNKLFVQNIVMHQGVHGDIEQGVASTAGGITKGLPVHYFIKGRIEKINYRNDPILDLVRYILHEPPKIRCGFRRYNPTGNYYFCSHL